MKHYLFAVALICFGSPVYATPYFHPGFNEVSGGIFAPFSNVDQQEAGLITPAIEHDAGPGGICLAGFCPGIGWNPLNLGYVGSTANAHDFLHGTLAIGPSVQTGELVKDAARLVCRRLLPRWNDAGAYNFLRAALAPGRSGVYADVGLYAGFPIHELGDVAHLKVRKYVGFTLVKTFVAAPVKP